MTVKCIISFFTWEWHQVSSSAYWWQNCFSRNEQCLWLAVLLFQYLIVVLFIIFYVIFFPHYIVYFQPQQMTQFQIMTLEIGKFYHFFIIPIPHAFVSEYFLFVSYQPQLILNILLYAYYFLFTISTSAN